ncbi:MAG: hypothetical protein HQM11_18570 [SAR324 cluster bacterium]|nr:hypothetical protein [SAR324 cluster bacterium]
MLNLLNQQNKYTIHMTDEDNDQVEGFLYYPHGEMMTNGQEMNNQVNHLFAGHEYDQETGLYYMRARFYRGEINGINLWIAGKWFFNFNHFQSSKPV